MYTLQSARIINFGLLKKVEVDFRGLGLTHVSGRNLDVPGASSNMSAKTTLLNAIVWALYGCNTIGKPLFADVIHHGAKLCAVEVIFVHDNGHKLRVKRIRRRNPGLKPTVSIIVGSKIGTPDVMQQRIDARIGARDLFLAAHIFGYDEEYVPFANRSDRDQKGLFDLLVSSEDLTAAGDFTSEVIEEHSNRRASVELALSACDLECARLESAIATATTINDVNISELEEQHKALTSNLMTIAKRRDDVVAQRRKYELAYNKSHNKCADLATIRGTLQHDKSTMEWRLSELIKTLPSTDDPNADVQCSECGSIVKSSTIAKHKLASIAETRIQLESSIGSVSDKLDKISKDHAAAVEKHNEYEAQYNAATTEERKENDAYRTVSNQINDLKRRLERAKEDDGAAQYRKRYVAERHEQAALRDLLEMLDEEAELLQFWKVGFGPQGIRAYRLAKVTPILNALAVKYSNQLFGDGTKVVYSTQTLNKNGEYRDRFSVTLHDKENNVITTALSAGQSMRRDLIHLFSVVDLAGKLRKRTVRFLAFDEAFRTVDTAGKNAVMDILRQHMHEARTILCLEHDVDLEDRFDQRLCVVRRMGESTVEVTP